MSPALRAPGVALSRRAGPRGEPGFPPRSYARVGLASPGRTSPALRPPGRALGRGAGPGGEPGVPPRPLGGPAGGTWVPPAFLSELFDHVGLTVGRRPGRAHVAVRAEDVGPVLGAVHEHRVGGRVARTARHPGDVLPALMRPQTATEVLVDHRPVLEDARSGHVRRPGGGDAGQTPAP